MSDAPKDFESQQVPNAALIGCTDLVAELRVMLRELDALSCEMLEHPKADAMYGLIERLQRWGCSASKHDWQYDQCGYWQHQYCIECGSAKYPDLAKRSCGELTAAMGKMTEAEFLSANVMTPNDQAQARPEKQNV